LTVSKHVPNLEEIEVILQENPIISNIHNHP